MAHDILEATLVVDSRRIERYLGTRSFAIAERQLVFRGGGAYVELRVPHAVAEGAGMLHGQYLARNEEDASSRRVSVRVRPPHGNGLELELGATGDFAVPFAASVPGTACVEFATLGRPTLLLRFDS